MGSSICFASNSTFSDKRDKRVDRREINCFLSLQLALRSSYSSPKKLRDFSSLLLIIKTDHPFNGARWLPTQDRSRTRSRFFCTVLVCFFYFLSTIKVNLVAKIIQSGYLYVIIHVKHKNYYFPQF